MYYFVLGIRVHGFKIGCDLLLKLQVSKLLLDPLRHSDKRVHAIL